MVGLVNSGIQQQIPAANTFQPGGAQQQTQGVNNERRAEQTPTQTSPATQSQQAETRNLQQNDTQIRQAAVQTQDQSEISADPSQPRGSVIDITV